MQIGTMKTRRVERYLFVLDEAGAPVFVFSPCVRHQAETRLYHDGNEDEIRTISEAVLGWGVAIRRESVAIVRNWCLLLVQAIGRRYSGFDYEAWRGLEKQGLLDLYSGGGRRDGEPEPSRVCSLSFSTSSGVLKSDHDFGDGFVWKRGFPVVYSPAEKTICVVSYRTEGRYLADLLASAIDLEEGTVRVQEPRR